MNAFLALARKEFVESLRTYKLLTLLIVFLILGIMSPPTAYFTADILRATGIDPAALGDPAVLSPTYVESFQQFFGNVSQLGLIVLVIIFSGSMVNDISRGTVVMLLAKGLRRDTVIYAKLFSSVLLWGLVYAASVAVAIGYTVYYFDIPSMANLFWPLFGVFVFGVLLLSGSLLGGVVFRNTIGALLVPVAIVGVGAVVGLFSNVSKYNPISLVTDSLGVLSGAIPESNFIIASAVSLVGVIVLTLLSIILFRRAQF